MIDLRNATASTPEPGEVFRGLSEAERIARVAAALNEGRPAFNESIVVADVKADGQVIVNLKTPMSASRRGPLLLDFEAVLKQSIDSGLVVWLEPLGDRNSLRNLRGIEVKS